MFPKALLYLSHSGWCSWCQRQGSSNRIVLWMIQAGLENTFLLLFPLFFLLFESLALFPALQLFKSFICCHICGKTVNLINHRKKKTPLITRGFNTNYLGGLISISVGMRSHFLQALNCLQPSR